MSPLVVLQQPIDSSLKLKEALMVVCVREEEVEEEEAGWNGYIEGIAVAIENNVLW